MANLKLQTGVGGLPAAANALALADLMIVGQSGGAATTGVSYRTDFTAVKALLLSGIALTALANAAAQYDVIGRKTAGAGAWEDCTRPQLLLAGTDLANTFTANQTINTTPAGTGLLVRTIDNGATGPLFRMQLDTASPAAGDRCGFYSFSAQDSAGNFEDYSQFLGRIVVPTSGAESGELVVRNMVAGVQTEVFRIATGTVVGTPTGGDIGANGYLNAERYYVGGNNLALPSGVIVGKMFTVGTLPGAGTVTAGGRLTVSDSNSTTFGNVVAGGGGNSVPVYVDNGSANWRIG